MVVLLALVALVALACEDNAYCTDLVPSGCDTEVDSSWEGLEDGGKVSDYCPCSCACEENVYCTDLVPSGCDTEVDSSWEGLEDGGKVSDYCPCSCGTGGPGGSGDGTTVSVTVLHYNYHDDTCSGNVIGVETFVQKMNTCKDKGDDGETSYEIYTCDGDSATSTVTMKEYGDSQCETTPTETTLVQDTCTMMDDSRVKLQFNCADGSAYNIDSLTSGMVGVRQKVYTGADCSGTFDASSTHTQFRKPNSCMEHEENSYAMATCNGGKIRMVDYTDSACTTAAAGGESEIANACLDIGGYSYKHEIFGCSSAAELTIFSLALVALFRF